MKKVSVVIPTRNRKESLLRTIDSIINQSYSVYEIIIVDASDLPIEIKEISKRMVESDCSVIPSTPSVCVQRNLGIKAAKGDYIFILDDDIVLDNDYLQKTMTFLSENKEAKIVSGLVLERNQLNEWRHTFPKTSFFSLVWTYLFQLGIWTNIKDVRGNFFTTIPLQWLKKYYLKKGNRLSNAGWPIVTSFDIPWFKTKTYGLGASIINREWLINNLYEEKLDSHGIGDNYGVAMGLNDNEFIYVLSTIHAYHYKEQNNRLAYVNAYSKRILALHYFIIKKNRSANKTVRWLVWSLIGNTLSSFTKGKLKLVVSNLNLIFIILLKKNPLL